MTAGEAGLLERARSWIDQDPDPVTRAELGALVDRGDLNELGERLAGELEFGTAGLRGIVGAGPARMNQAVILRASRALADHLLAAAATSTTLAPVVVGFDARLHSRALAEAVSGTLVAAGLSVRYFPEPVATPLVVFAAGELGSPAAVMVTASHNPPEYNGFKLYDETAVQIAPPLDTAIARRIADIGPANSIPCALKVFAGGDPGAEPIDDGLFDRYLARVDELRTRSAGDSELRIVYTPLHGVGWRFVRRALARAGYPHVVVVPEQAEPDGTFPTAPIPNPEDAAALRLALELGERTSAHLVLANDPDADRLAVAGPVDGGVYAPLTGNQVGLLLADHLLERSSDRERCLVVASVVSTPLLAALVEGHGAKLEWTLTGFKWISRAARERARREGLEILLGFEEAIGYAPGSVVLDKDGISTAVLLADLAADARAAGETVRDRLDRIYCRHGLWVSLQRNMEALGAAGSAMIQRAMQRVVECVPTALAGRRVREIVDYSRGAETRPAWRPNADLVELRLEPAGRVAIRPSGTEPKLKVYVDLLVAMERDQSVCEREQQGLDEASDVARDLFRHVGLG